MASLRNLTFTSLILTLFALSCGKTSTPPQSSSDQIHASLKLEDLTNGECLNIEKLATYLNHDQFNFPARKTTLSYSSNALQTALFIRNFENQNFQLSTLPFFRTPQQQDCTHVKTATAYGRMLAYNITSYDNSSLTLELAPPPEMENLDEVIRESYASEPVHSKIFISLESPTSLILQLDSETLIARCGSSKSVSYNKKMIYRWAPRSSDLPPTELIPYQTVETIRNLLHGTTAHLGPFDLNSETPSPEPLTEPLELQINDIEILENELAKLEFESLCGQ